MIRLDSTNKSVTLKLAAPVTTNELDFTSSWDAIKTTQPRQYIPTSDDGTSNGTTAVTIVSAPSSNFINNIKYISVHNNDTVISNVIIELLDGMNSFVLIKAMLDPGDTIVYNDGAGWKTINSDGIIKSVVVTTTDINFIDSNF